MNKGVLIFLFLLTAATVFGQSKSKVQLIKSTVSEVVKGPNGRSILKVRNGVFKQDFSTLTSDSALFYQDQNMVDAFGHVNINQGDTLNIFSDKLNYNGNTKVALLTDHVKMIDRDATLTTNYFTYNTATRIGIYTGGGKLVNKDNTLTSKNGYYFASTRDEYFRYNVVCTTPDAVIKTDTLRYNSGSRIAYFYGPTNITGKDKDNLYTENGTYNTVTEQAFFGKKNLYTQTTKSLKGDSLFYDRLKGYGRATKNVTFDDTEQKMTLKGDLGEYFKADERAVITQGAYMIFVTEDTTAVKPGNNKIKTDTLLKNQKTAIVDKGHFSGKQLTLQGITDSVTKRLPANLQGLPVGKTQMPRGMADSVMKKASAAVKNLSPGQKIVLKGITDSVSKRVPGMINKKGLPVSQQAITKLITDKLKDTSKLKDNLKLLGKPRNVHYDSLFFAADTLSTKIITYKELKEMQQRQYELSHRDTSIKIVKKKISVVYKKSPKFLTPDPRPELNLITKTDYWDPLFFGKPTPPKPKPQPKVIPKAAPKIVKVVPKKTLQDSLKDKRIADSLALRAPKQLSDTSRIRIISGHYHAKLFKSDLQSKADSMFYSSSDSTIRCYTNPIIWTQGSQLSGDTINLQMKNKKLDNFDMFPSAFIVNLDKGDSVNFNQAAGRAMHGTFKNNKLNSIRIVGNAETIFFKRDSATNKITEMNRTISGIIQGRLNNGEISNLDFYQSTESKTTPIVKVKEEDKILKGFLWKPKERPASKEAVIAGYKKPVIAKSATGNKPTGKPGIKKPGNNKLTGDTTLNRQAILKMGKDSLSKDTTAKKLLLKMGKDSVLKDTARKPVVIKKP